MENETGRVDKRQLTPVSSANSHGTRVLMFAWENGNEGKHPFVMHGINKLTAAGES
jgi:hypothetical protein